MFLFLKKNLVALTMLTVITVWLVYGLLYHPVVMEKRGDVWLILRVLGSWMFPLLLALLWLKKEKFIYLSKRYSYYLTGFVFGIAALAVMIMVYLGQIKCSLSVSGDWARATSFYFYLFLPSFSGLGIVLTSFILILVSVVAEYIPERFFGIYSGKNNKMFVLILLFLWVTFLPNIMMLFQVF